MYLDSHIPIKVGPDKMNLYQAVSDNIPFTIGIKFFKDDPRRVILFVNSEFNDAEGHYLLIEDDQYSLCPEKSLSTIGKDHGFKQIITKKQFMLIKMGLLDEDLVNDVMKHLLAQLMNV